MIVSTRGRYALRVLVDMAEHSQPDPNSSASQPFHSERIPLKEIAERQEISQKYVESIMTLLSKNNLVDAAHGKGGGYKLNRPAKDYKIGDILRITEGTLAPVACLEENAEECKRKPICRTLKLWSKLDELIEGYLDSVTLADLMTKE